MRLAALLLLLSSQALAASYAVVGDGGHWNAMARSVRDSILRDSGTRALILPGDNLYDVAKTYEQVWSPWSSKGLVFDVVAIGNHTRGYAEETRFFRMPGEYYARSEGALVRFLVLNSDNERTAAAQAQWLDQELTNARERFVFPVYHHPTYTVTSYHNWKEKAAFQRTIRPVLRKHRARITALLLGHDHIASLVTFDDLPAVVSGAVHETRAPERWNDTQDGVAVRTQWIFPRRAYWVRLRLPDEGAEAQAEFVRADNDQVSCGVRIATGKPAVLSSRCAEETRR